MSTQIPRVSIGLPVYNGERYVAAAIDSLMAQTFADFELIISDNASTDGTAEICRDYAARDFRIRYVRHEVNRGAPWNFNQAFELARGEYFKWHAADDLCAPTLLENCVAMLDADPSIALCYPRTMVIDAEGNLLPDAPGSWKPVETNGLPANKNQSGERGLESWQYADRVRGILLHTVFCYELFGVVRREVMQRTGLHRDSSSLGKAFLMEVAFQGRLVEAPEVLFFNRRHAQQYTMLTSAAEQQCFDRPNETQSRWQWPHHFRCTAIYASCIGQAAIPIRQRLRCGAVLLRYIFQVSKWRQILHSAWRGTGMWNGSLSNSDPEPVTPVQTSNSTHLPTELQVHAIPPIGRRSPSQLL